MDEIIINKILSRALQIANKHAMRGAPIELLVWTPPQTACSDPFGSFYIQYYDLSKYGDADY